MRARGVLAAAIVGAALATAGCGRDLDDAAVATTAGVQLNAEQKAAVRASRALVTERSPASVVMTFIQDLRDGAGPALLPVYDSRIPDRVGKGDVLGALQVMTGLVAGTEPVVTRQRKTRAGQLVVVRLLRTVGSDTRYSFLLRRDEQRWKIVYDSLMVQGLQSYVSSRVARGSTTPSPAAARAAARAVADMQLATLYQPPTNRRRGSDRPTQESPPAGSRSEGAGTTAPTEGTETTPGQ